MSRTQSEESAMGNHVRAVYAKGLRDAVYRRCLVVVEQKINDEQIVNHRVLSEVLHVSYDIITDVLDEHPQLRDIVERCRELYGKNRSSAFRVGGRKLPR
jgi:hypothetical protein